MRLYCNTKDCDFNSLYSRVHEQLIYYIAKKIRDSLLLKQGEHHLIRPELTVKIITPTDYRIKDTVLQLKEKFKQNIDIHHYSRPANLLLHY